MLQEKLFWLFYRGARKKVLTGGNKVLQIFWSRDIIPQKQGIQDMANEPSRDELHEMAKEKCRSGAVVPAKCVEEQLEKIRENKKSGRLEHGSFSEHLTIDFWDLVDVISDNGKALEVGYEAHSWNLNIRGDTSLGVTLNVWCNLYKKSDLPLQITSFQPALVS